jgi:hypothetical protein
VLVVCCYLLFVGVDLLLFVGARLAQPQPTTNKQTQKRYVERRLLFFGDFRIPDSGFRQDPAAYVIKKHK